MSRPGVKKSLSVTTPAVSGRRSTPKIVPIEMFTSMFDEPTSGVSVAMEPACRIRRAGTIPGLGPGPGRAISRENPSTPDGATHGPHRPREADPLLVLVREPGDVDQPRPAPQPRRPRRDGQA